MTIGCIAIYQLFVDVYMSMCKIHKKYQLQRHFKMIKIIMKIHFFFFLSTKIKYLSQVLFVDLFVLH